MTLIRILVIFSMVALAGCISKNKDENDDGTGIDDGGYVITPEIFLFAPHSFNDRLLDFRKDKITFNTVKDVVDITGNCSGIYTHYGAVNQANGYRYDVNDNKSCDILGMKLNEGENYIEGYSCNDKGYTYRFPIVIIRNTTVDFTGSISLSEDEFDEDEDLNVIASIPIGPLNVPDDGSVQLYLSYDNGSRLNLTTLNDNGGNGDVTAGDGLYSGTFNTDLLKEGRYEVKVSATAKGKENISAPVHIDVFPADMDKMMKKETAVAESIAQKYYKDLSPIMSDSELVKYGRWVSKQIKDTDNLVKTVVGEDGALGLYFKHLKLYVIMPGTDGDIDETQYIPRIYDMPEVTFTDENHKSVEKYEGLYNNLIENTPLISYQ